MTIRAVVFDVGNVLELSDDVHDLAYSHEAGLLKPNPRIYLLSCERLGVRPQEAVFLDDRESFTRAARAVGMRAVHFTGDNAAAIAEITALLGGLYVPAGEPQRSRRRHP